MLPLTSKQITISIPSLLIFSFTLELWGRASAVTSRATASKRNTNNTGLNRTFQEAGIFFSPSKEETFKEACCFLCMRIYHHTISGKSSNNQKNHGLANSIYFKLSEIIIKLLIQLSQPISLPAGRQANSPPPSPA